MLFLLFLIARRIVNSPFGLSLRSVKGNPLRAASVGIHVNGRLVTIYTIAAGYAGIAGALLTQSTQFASLSVLDFERSADVMLIVIIGGTGYLYGGLIGAVLFKLVQDYLANVNPQYWQFWLGLMLVMMIMFGRVYGAAMAALIFAICTWTKLPFMHSIVFTLALLFVLGIARPQVLKFTSAITERANRRAQKAESALQSPEGCLLMAPVLETSGLTRQFGGIIAANDVTLSVEKGARHALIGPNGAGKTTVINMLTGVLRPTAGSILLEGRDITDLEAAQARGARHRAHVPDQPAVRRSDAARDDRARGLRTHGARPPVVAARRLEDHRDRGIGRHPQSLQSHRRDGRAHRQLCPTASSACWRSRSRSRAGRTCCCSTSPPPACPRRSGTTFSMRSRRCRAT